MIDPTERHKYGLLLSGGGARAAYQVGVLKAITTFLPRSYGVPFSVICGTSAGAINAASLATYASCYHLGVRKLEWVWRSFKTDHVYATNFSGTFGHIIKNFAMGLQTEQVQRPYTSLLDNRPLRKLLNKTLNLKRIDNNIHLGKLKALGITASSYTNRDAVTFFQGSPDLKDWHRAHRRGVSSQIDIEHLMASSAIPIVFPMVNHENEYLGDGAIHQFSPLSAPIHLGAEKILIIGLEQPCEQEKDPKVITPSMAMIAGHLLDAVFSDALNSDIERLERINDTLKLLSPKQRAQTHLKEVKSLIINPSQSFDSIAYKYYYSLPLSIRQLLKFIGVNGNGKSSLLSYLLFEQDFCQELIQMGYHDGLDNKDSLKGFLDI